VINQGLLAFFEVNEDEKLRELEELLKIFLSTVRLPFGVGNENCPCQGTACIKVGLILSIADYFCCVDFCSQNVNETFRNDQKANNPRLHELCFHLKFVICVNVSHKNAFDPRLNFCVFCFLPYPWIKIIAPPLTTGRSKRSASPDRPTTVPHALGTQPAFQLERDSAGPPSNDAGPYLRGKELEDNREKVLFRKKHCIYSTFSPDLPFESGITSVTSCCAVFPSGISHPGRRAARLNLLAWYSAASR